MSPAAGASEGAVLIAEIEALHMRLGRVEEKADGTQEVLLVRVTTDTGLVGHGEAVSNATVARSIVAAPRSAPFRHGLAVSLIGADALQPEARWLDMYNATRWYGRRGAAIHAMAAVDTALWDILGQSRGLACHALWGTQRRRIPAYASVLFPETPGEGGRLAESLVARGFRAIKFGWGRFGRDRSWDLEMLAEIREAVGHEVAVMVDAGRIWSVQEAVIRAPSCLSASTSFGSRSRCMRTIWKAMASWPRSSMACIPARELPPARPRRGRAISPGSSSGASR